MLDLQGGAEGAGAALPPQDQSDAGRIHKAYPAEIQHKSLRSAADQRIVQLDAQTLGRIVVHLAGKIRIQDLACCAETYRCHCLVHLLCS